MIEKEIIIQEPKVAVKQRIAGFKVDKDDKSLTLDVRYLDKDDNEIHKEDKVYRDEPESSGYYEKEHEVLKGIVKLDKPIEGNLLVKDVSKSKILFEGDDYKRTSDGLKILKSGVKNVQITYSYKKPANPKFSNKFMNNELYETVKAELYKILEEVGG